MCGPIGYGFWVLDPKIDIFPVFGNASTNTLKV